MMLDNIQELINESVTHSDVIPYLKVIIKNFLENCRSPLDYTANYIFFTYCEIEYTAQELRSFSVYSPIRYKPRAFNSCILKNYRTLSTKRPDLVNVFESA